MQLESGNISVWICCQCNKICLFFKPDGWKTIILKIKPCLSVFSDSQDESFMRFVRVGEELPVVWLLGDMEKKEVTEGEMLECICRKHVIQYG